MPEPVAELSVVHKVKGQVQVKDYKNLIKELKNNKFSVQETGKLFLEMIKVLGNKEENLISHSKIGEVIENYQNDLLNSKNGDRYDLNTVRNHFQAMEVIFEACKLISKENPEQEIHQGIESEDFLLMAKHFGGMLCRHCEEKIPDAITDDQPPVIIANRLKKRLSPLSGLKEDIKLLKSFLAGAPGEIVEALKVHGPKAIKYVSHITAVFLLAALEAQSHNQQ